MSGCTRTRQLIELAFSGLMKRLVVLRPEHADLSRVLRDLIDAGEASGQLLAPYGGSSPCNRSSARVLDECIAIRLGATLALFIRHLVRLSSFSKSDRMGSFSPCLAAGKLQQHRNRI